MRQSGILNIQVNGTVYDAVGNFTFNLGLPKREALIGHDRVHGYKELPQVPMIEGEIRDSKDLDYNVLFSMDNATVTLTQANGKTVTLSGAWYAGDGNVETEEATIEVRFEGTGMIVTGD